MLHIWLVIDWEYLSQVKDQIMLALNIDLMLLQKFYHSNNTIIALANMKPC